MRFRSLCFVCLRLSSSVILTCLDALAINPTFLTCMFQLSSKILVILITMFTHSVVLSFNVFSMAFDFLTERSRGFVRAASSLAALEVFEEAQMFQNMLLMFVHFVLDPFCGTLYPWFFGLLR